MSPAERVQIVYRRLPDDERIYDQRVVHEGEGAVITLSEPLALVDPMIHDGRVMLEAGSLAVWFTFPGAWHDIGRFHRADGTFTGIYANVLTPPEMVGRSWRTTDLFLDVWWPAGGSVTLLDEAELAEAVERGHIDPGLAGEARTEARRLLADADGGTWPPPLVESWTLPRALEALAAMA